VSVDALWCRVRAVEGALDLPRQLSVGEPELTPTPLRSRAGLSEGTAHRLGFGCLDPGTVFRSPLELRELSCRFSWP